MSNQSNSKIDYASALGYRPCLPSAHNITLCGVKDQSNSLPTGRHKPEQRSSLHYSPLLFVLAAAVLWSTGGLFIKWTSISGLELSFGRSLLAAITVAIFTRHEGFGLNRVTALASVLYAALLLLFVLATKETTAANAIFLQYTAPVYLLILEPLFYKEKFRSRDLITVVVCVLGMSLFFVGKLRPQDVTGNLLALASGFCFACYFLLLRHTKSRAVNRASSVIYGNLLVVLIAAPAGLKVLPRLTTHDALSVLYLGVVQIGLAYTLFTVAMARGVRSLDAGIVGYVEPVLNPIWVFLVLGERPNFWALVGGSIIVIAVVGHMLMEARSGRRPAHLP
jgi:DME family drug/metabolite transporter